MAPAAHRDILQYICSDTHKLALWLSPTSFVDNAAYPQTLGQIACAPPAPKHPLYAGHTQICAAPPALCT